jgi:hypothetical protein
MWCCVDLVLTDVSEERIASIFRVEKSSSEEPEAICSHLLALIPLLLSIAKRRSRVS